MREVAIELEQPLVLDDAGGLELVGEIVQIHAANRTFLLAAVLIFQRDQLIGKGFLFQRDGRLNGLLVQSQNVGSSQPSDAGQDDADAEHKGEVNHTAETTALPVAALADRGVVLIGRLLKIRGIKSLRGCGRLPNVSGCLCPLGLLGRAHRAGNTARRLRRTRGRRGFTLQRSGLLFHGGTLALGSLLLRRALLLGSLTKRTIGLRCGFIEFFVDRVRHALSS